MVNYILVYKIRKQVKDILKEKIEEGEIATTPRSCLGCLADEISWEVYYLFKEMEEKKKGAKGLRKEKNTASGSPAGDSFETELMAGKEAQVKANRQEEAGISQEDQSSEKK
jgi:hypothetical protein